MAKPFRASIKECQFDYDEPSVNARVLQGSARDAVGLLPCGDCFLSECGSTLYMRDAEHYGHKQLTKDQVLALVEAFTAVAAHMK